MATVTQLADRVCQIARLATTGDERDLVLDALNDAYQEAVEETGCKVADSTVSLSAGTSDYSLSGDLSLTRVVRILKAMVVQSDGRVVTLDPASTAKLWERRRVGSGGTLREWAMDGTDTLRLWPEPSSAESLKLVYVQEPLTLVETVQDASTEESTPSAIPSRYHRDILVYGALIRAMELDQRVDGDLEYWVERFGRGLARLAETVNRMSEEPAPFFDVGGHTGVEYPDTYGRGR